VREKRAPHAARRLLADRQPLDERGPAALPGDGRFCTALPILALLLFGGDTLKDFAFALLIGTISGAYSSIFIASPVLTHWKEREAQLREACGAHLRRARRGARPTRRRSAARPWTRRAEGEAGQAPLAVRRGPTS